MAEQCNLKAVRAEICESRRLLAISHDAIARSANALVRSQASASIPPPSLSRLHLSPLFSCNSVAQLPPAPPAQADCGHRQEISTLERQVETLQQALASRDSIGMAKGILMARKPCTPDEAFDILRRASQRTNRKLTAVASEIVASNIPQRNHP